LNSFDRSVVFQITSNRGLDSEVDSLKL